MLPRKDTIVISLIGGLLFIASCNEASFDGGTKSASEISSQDQTAKVLENGILTYEIVAGEKATVLLADLGKASELIDFDKSKLPDDAQFDKDKGAIVWETDLQDIGVTQQSRASLRVDGVDGFDLDFQVKVKEPPIGQAACSVVIPPVIGAVKPTEAWHWPGLNGYVLTYSSPVAGDLNGDGQVEVVSIASTSTYEGTNAMLAVLKGKTGEILWNSMDSGISVLSSTTPSLADLDKDGNVEIVAAALNAAGGKDIIVIDYKNKVVKARYSDPSFVCSVYCNTAIGDIDGDGSPEIVAGNVVLNADATKKVSLPPSRNTSVLDAPTIADLVPSSPGQEIIFGSSIYSTTGALLSEGDCTGFSAVADLESDGKPDLICIGGGDVYRYANSGTLLWKREIPRDPAAAKVRGGAPNIGDFNGDGKMEIGTAGGAFYVVYDKDGNEVWKMPTKDVSSLATGSSLFDFNGDGKVEVVYNDEVALRIYDGATGTVLFTEPNPSGTLWEYPLIVNADDDKSVEIVLSSPGKGGVRMFKDPTKLWVGSRNLWNQYSYYPENVDDKLKIVAKPGISKVGFRVNTPGSLSKGDRKLLPDIQAKIPYLFDRDHKNDTNLTVLLFNAGEALPSEAVLVELVLKDGTSVSQEIVDASKLEPKQSQIVKLSVPADQVAAVKAGARVRLNLDSDGKAKAQECKVDNNDLELKIQR